MRFTIHGHCPSKKNHRPIHKAGGSGKPFVGKSPALRRYEQQARVQLILQCRAHGLRAPMTGPVRCRLIVYYSGPRPDALGPAETIYDLLEAAQVVENDRQLVPWGEPAVELVHVSRAREMVEVYLGKEESHDG